MGCAVVGRISCVELFWDKTTPEAHVIKWFWSYQWFSVNMSVAMQVDPPRMGAPVGPQLQVSSEQMFVVLGCASAGSFTAMHRPQALPQGRGPPQIPLLRPQPATITAASSAVLRAPVNHPLTPLLTLRMRTYPCHVRATGPPCRAAQGGVGRQSGSHASTHARWVGVEGVVGRSPVPCHVCQAAGVLWALVFV